jgi:hypothetical protein
MSGRTDTSVSAAIVKCSVDWSAAETLVAAIHVGGMRVSTARLVDQSGKQYDLITVMSVVIIKRNWFFWLQRVHVPAVQSIHRHCSFALRTLTLMLMFNKMLTL